MAFSQRAFESPAVARGGSRIDSDYFDHDLMMENFGQTPLFACYQTTESFRIAMIMEIHLTSIGCTPSTIRQFGERPAWFVREIW
jgi:hypothetical protein